MPSPALPAAPRSLSSSPSSAPAGLPRVKPELLAPAGDWECARAAVANGADAIYFGLPRFNARLRAENFTEEDLPRLLEFLHSRGVRGFVTFNTLVFTGELPAAAAQLVALRRAGVDAIIVQDLGLARLAARLTPGLEVHASTQMTLTSPEGVRFARRLGVARAVLARELSLRELARFAEPGPDGQPPLPVEVFVHGALCVAYSGQCLTSEALGQRSANRGECAQACRLPYSLVVDGALRDLGERRYLLSPQDLAAAEEIPALIRLGVVSFKIEGRLKSPEYVAAVTRVYRRVIDAAWEQAGGPAADPATPAAPAGAAPPAAAGPTGGSLLTRAERYELEMTFSRGLFSGWLHGVDHQRLVHARFGKKRGALVGRVGAVGPDHVELAAPPDVALRPGDGVVFEAADGDTDREQGGRLHAVDGRRLRFGRGRLDPRGLSPGQRVWKTDDPALDAALRATFAKDPPARRERMDVRASGAAGTPLRLTGRLPARPGRQAEVVSRLGLAPARNRPLTVATLRAQLGRLGDTRLVLGEVDASGLAGDTMLPVSELNRLRRELAAALDEPAAAHPGGEAAGSTLPADWLADLRRDLDQPSPEPVPPTTAAGELLVLCRSDAQLAAALECGVPAVYLDYEDVRRYRDAVARFRREAAAGTAIFLATPRIQKAGEQGFFKLVEQAGPDGVLVRNLGGIDSFRDRPGLRRVGDFSLNVANPATAALLRREGRLERLTVSYDLNADQVNDLLRAAPRGWFELVIHQHMPLFHMEHCVFAAFLSAGKDHLSCGRPCDRHQVRLRDRVGLEHPVKADVGCRNTVFHARAQSGAAFLETFRRAGVGAFRVELLDEDGAQARRVISGYQELLAGRLSAVDLLGRLQAANQLGVTDGTLTVLHR